MKILFPIFERQTVQQNHTWPRTQGPTEPSARIHPVDAVAVCLMEVPFSNMITGMLAQNGASSPDDALMNLSSLV